MRNSGSYQLVSKHSIPGDQRDSMRKKTEARVGGLEHRMDSLEHRVEGVEAKLEEIKRCLRMLDTEPVRRQTRRQRAPTERSGNRFEPDTVTKFAKEECEQLEEKNEKIFSDLKYKNSLQVVKSRKSEDSDRGKEDVIISAPEEFMKENDGIRGEGSIREPLDVVKPEGSEGNGDDKESPPVKPEDSTATATATATDGGAILNEVWPTNRLGEIVLSHETEVSGGEEEEEKSKRNDGTREGRCDVSYREPPDKEVAMAELQCAHDVGVQRVREFSLCVEMRNRQEWEKKNWAEVYSFSIPLGQAQVTVSKSAPVIKSAQTLIFTPTQFIINEEVLQDKREVDPVANSLGQVHNFIITPSIFTNSGGVLQVAGGLENKRDHPSAKLTGTFPKLLGHQGTDLSLYLHELPIAKQVVVIKIDLLETTYGGRTSPTPIIDQFFNFPLPLQKSRSVSINIEVEEIITSLGRNNSGFAKYEWHKLMAEQFIQREELPLVHQWALGGIKKYGWDPGGNKRDESNQSTSAMECHGNQTQPYHKWYHQVLFTFQQIIDFVDNYWGVSMSSRVLNNPIVRVVQFNNEERWLKIASDRENKKLHPSIHESLNWNQCIGAEIGVTKRSQCLHARIILGMYSNSLHIENVLLHHHIVAKISSYNSPLLPNMMKAWHEKSTNGFKHSSSNKSVMLEDESNIQGVGVMLLEFIIGKTTKKTNDVEAFKSLLQASTGDDEEAWRSNVDPENCKAYLAKSLKALIEICVDHLIQGFESSRRPMRETHHKQWDPGELYSTSCIIGTSSFKLWDPGGRLVMACFDILTLRTR